MPTITRYFIRTAFVFLILGILLMMVSWEHRNFYSVALHFLTLGWITNMIFGVAFWMFPKRKYVKDNIPRIAFLLLNLGLILRLASEPFGIWLVFSISSFMQFLASLLFSLHIWKRLA